MKNIRMFLIQFLASFQLGRATSGIEKALKSFDTAAPRAEQAKQEAERNREAAELKCIESIRKAEARKLDATLKAEDAVVQMDAVIRKSRYAKENFQNLIIPPEDR